MGWTYECLIWKGDGISMDDWLVVWNIFIFPYIGNVIIPTDELIFFRGVGIPPTSNISELYIIIYHTISWYIIDVLEYIFKNGNVVVSSF